MRAIKAHLSDFVWLILLFLAGVGVTAYVIEHQQARGFLPLVQSKPFVLNADFATGQAVTPGQGQTVRVAGIEVGKITMVTLTHGVARVELQISPQFVKRLNIRTDASALLRPKTGLKDMFVELDPGGRGGPIKSGYTIPISNTAPDVNPDEILSAFDTDTRQYLQLLINSAGKGLSGHGNDLNLTFKALQPTTHDLRRITTAVAQRGAELKQLIHNYGDLTNALADTDGSIQTLVNSSDQVFRAFAAQAANIQASIAKLPPTLETTTATLNKARNYAPLLATTLNRLDPVFRQLDVANHALLPFAQTATPIIAGQIRPFVQVARPYVRNLRPAAVNLARATPDLVSSFRELNRFFDMLTYNPAHRKVPVTGNPAVDATRDQGYLFWLAWLGQTSTSLFNTSDATGALRRYLVSADCNTLRQLVAANPAAGPLLGLTNPLNDAGLCPPGAGGSGLHFQGTNGAGQRGRQASPAGGQVAPGAHVVINRKTAPTIEQK